MYPLLKTLHISCAVLSYALFFLRGIWSLKGSPLMQQRWIRIVPHLIDTILLGSAVALAVTIRRYPLVDAWLTAKVLALLLYIGLGFVALKYGRNRTARVSAWLAAQAVFIYIALVAVQHDPFPFFG
ncbi:MAG: SirB2 family protein [Nitrosomonadales bacterium]|nr:SirB2 family protein [Nitrosomonadales bacterium]